MRKETTLELLVSAVKKEPKILAEEMKITSRAIIINQTDTFGYEEWEKDGKKIRAYSLAEKGVGLSRNTALLRADSDICLFSDEDIRYVDGYEELILAEFRKNKEADLILFYVEVCESRRTYTIESEGRVRIYNSGRYPAYSIAARRESLHQKNITFSLLFGGGAIYSNGEDSLFLKDCLKKGLKIFKVPVRIGKEEERESTWFQGYTEKFFGDRGVLYHHLYGRMAIPFAFRFLYKHKDIMCQEIEIKKAYQLMLEGIREGKRS